MHKVQGFKNRSGNCRKLLGAALIAAFLVAAGGPSSAQERGRCASVALEWPVRLPDGSVHNARTLSLCLSDYWTPVSGLHELKVNGQAVGRFVSRVGFSEGSVGTSPIVVFERGSGGAYRLVGYAWPSGDRMRTFALGATDHDRGRAGTQLHAALAQPDQELIVVASHQSRRPR